LLAFKSLRTFFRRSAFSALLISSFWAPNVAIGMPTQGQPDHKPRPVQPPPPDVGAYTEPAPKVQQFQHAVRFVDSILKQRDSKDHITNNALEKATKKGIILRASPGNASKSRRRPVTLDRGPFERAGLTSPTNQQTSGTVFAYLIAAALAALGLGMEAATRLRKRR
jgi:hypothetical protein